MYVERYNFIQITFPYVTKQINVYRNPNNNLKNPKRNINMNEKSYVHHRIWDIFQYIQNIVKIK